MSLLPNMMASLTTRHPSFHLHHLDQALSKSQAAAPATRRHDNSRNPPMHHPWPPSPSAPSAPRARNRLGARARFRVAPSFFPALGPAQVGLPGAAPGVSMVSSPATTHTNDHDQGFGPVLPYVRHQKPLSKSARNSFRACSIHSERARLLSSLAWAPASLPATGEKTILTPWCRRPDVDLDLSSGSLGCSALDSHGPTTATAPRSPQSLVDRHSKGPFSARVLLNTPAISALSSNAFDLQDADT
jgi:hypothetical protein